MCAPSTMNYFMHCRYDVVDVDAEWVLVLERDDVFIFEFCFFVEVESLCIFVKSI